MSDYKVQQAIIAKKKKQKVQELFKALIDEVNTMGSEDAVSDGLVDGLLCSHRTLQQSFIRSFMNACQKIDKMENITDARNEQAIKVLKEISKLDETLPFV